MNIVSNQGVQPVVETETVTITVSKKFLKNLQEVAYLFADDKKDLGFTLEYHGAWVFKNLCEETNDLREAIDEVSWSSREECVLSAQRIAEKLGPNTKVQIGGKGDDWLIHTFASARSYADWTSCQAEGLDYEEECARRRKIEDEAFRAFLAELPNRREDNDGEEWKA
jgi:hypothetical protein